MDPLIGLPLLYLGVGAMMKGLNRVRQNYIDNHYVPPQNNRQNNSQDIFVEPNAQPNAQPVSYRPISNQPLYHPTQQQIPNKGFHGTSLLAAHDIFNNQRFLPGKENALWLATTFKEGKRYAQEKGGENGIIIEFEMDPNGTCLTRHPMKVIYLFVEVRNPDPGAYYSMPGMLPTALYDLQGQLIASKYSW